MVVGAGGDRASAGRGALARRRHSRLRRTLVAPCTTNIRGLPSEVVLDPGEDPVPKLSAVNLDSIESVSVTVLVERLGVLSDDRMRDVCAALAVAVDFGR